jgi:hypothetical protein
MRLFLLRYVKAAFGNFPSLLELRYGIGKFADPPKSAKSPEKSGSGRKRCILVCIQPSC